MAYVHGVSTARSTTWSLRWAPTPGSPESEVSRVCADLDVEVSAFRDRSLAEQEFPYLFVDATAFVLPHAVHRAVQLPPGHPRPPAPTHERTLVSRTLLLV